VSEPAARLESPRDGVASLVIDRPDDAINALNLALIEAFAAAIAEARSISDLQGLVIRSGKPGQFVAGADLAAIGQASTADDLAAAARAFQRPLNDLEALPCTTVAAIGGPALGGGLELALACDYRVAADSPAVSIGQPEIQLGLIPAGGGTQRLPALIGLPAGLDLILAGRRLNPGRALRAGVVDEVVHPAALLQAAEVWARRGKRGTALPAQTPNALTPNPLPPIWGRGRGVRGLSGMAARAAEQTPLGRKLILAKARERVERETGGHYPAPLRAIEAIEIGLREGRQAGLDAEARAFGELATGDVSRNLVALFFATQRKRRDPGVDDRSVEPHMVATIGVVGAGLMGSGIAEVAAVSSFTVRLRDVSPERVADGLSRVQRLMDEATERRHFRPREARDIMARISGTVDYSGFRRADLAIEAVFEEIEVKRRVIHELESAVREGAIIASNTSTIPITSLAAEAGHPERVVGMHFFSPVHRMPLVEVIRGERSADWAVATVVDVSKRMGKTPIVVNDGPGFYTSRVIGCMMNEAGQVLEGGADIGEVDQAMRAFGWPVGPFELLDEVGLDVAAHAGTMMATAFGERLPAARPVALLVELGRSGRKGGRGFYRYDRKEKRPDPDVYELIGAARVAGRAADVPERLTSRFVVEAIRCLEEGILRSPTDGDLGAVLGLGFPPFLGGPFHYVDRLGAARFRDSLESLSGHHGERFSPPARLLELARTGGRFHE